MKKVSVFSILFLSLAAGVAHAEFPCVERAECMTYNDGLSNLYSAPLSLHEESRNIPDFVYIKAVIYNSEGQRTLYKDVGSLWYRAITSGYSLATGGQHNASRRESLKLAIQDCNAAVEQLRFNISSCH